VCVYKYIYIYIYIYMYVCIYVYMYIYIYIYMYVYLEKCIYIWCAATERLSPEEAARQAEEVRIG